MTPERPSSRSFWGMLILLVGMVVYISAAAALGELLIGWPTAVVVIYYLIAGILWIFPVKYLLRWMAGKTGV